MWVDDIMLIPIEMVDIIINGIMVIAVNLLCGILTGILLTVVIRKYFMG